MSDKRAQFFLLSAAVSFGLTLLAGDDFRVLTIGVGVLYVLLAIASALDHNSRG
jgi:hypothetical protein